jgi:hypothetical protein
MKIIIRSQFEKHVISKLEEKYNAKYVCDSSEREGVIPISIFYTETPHPKGSNYIGIALNDKGMVIFNAKDIADIPIFGVMVGKNIIYSVHRHDFHELNGIYIDGGRSYTRTNASKEDIVNLVVDKGELRCLKIQK